MRNGLYIHLAITISKRTPQFANRAKPVFPAYSFRPEPKKQDRQAFELIRNRKSGCSVRNSIIQNLIIQDLHIPVESIYSPVTCKSAPCFSVFKSISRTMRGKVFMFSLPWCILTEHDRHSYRSNRWIAYGF